MVYFQWYSVQSVRGAVQTFPSPSAGVYKPFVSGSIQTALSTPAPGHLFAEPTQ